MNTKEISTSNTAIIFFISLASNLCCIGSAQYGSESKVSSLPLTISYYVCSDRVEVWVTHGTEIFPPFDQLWIIFLERVSEVDSVYSIC